MALPYSPRTSWDVTVDLRTHTGSRALEGGTYSGKHVRVIPKDVIDDQGLIFNGCASATIIGGHFKPAALPRYGAGSIAPGSLTFNNVNDVYIEGVLLDNINIYDNGGDGTYIQAQQKLTQVTMQNCRYVNVRGTQEPASAHGDVFQAGSVTQGVCGPIRVYNFTAYHNYQGFFLDPQSPGGNTSVELTNVNLVRQGTTTTRLFYFYANQSRYDSYGYPITLNNCWADPGSGQLVERDAVWPASYAGSSGQFPNSNYWAVRGTDSNGAYAHWPGLNAAGKALIGRIYEGRPVGGDIVKENKVGIGYVQGVDLSEEQPELVDASEIQFYRHF